MKDVIINAEDVRFSYVTAEGVAPIVLDGVSLSIEEGSFVAVLGHNGSGKSTLAKHFNSILLPTGGRVYVDGMDTADEELLLAIRRTVGMVFQNPTRSWPTWWRRMWPSRRRTWASLPRRSAAGWTTP